MAYEGVIKFKYINEDQSFLIPDDTFKIINPVRQLLKEKDYLGQYPDGISYGNISIRDKNSNEFYITASDTGKIKDTLSADYVKITSCDLINNVCYFKGAALPSSETLSHHIIYSYCNEAKAVIHIHNKALWFKLKDKAPTTATNVEYGTIEMVNEIINLLQNTNLKNEKILVMGGHEDGLISFGGTIDEAYNQISQGFTSITLTHTQ